MTTNGMNNPNKYRSLNRMNIIVVDNRAKAGECGAINVLIGVMEAHIRDANICENGSRALWNITLNGKVSFIKNVHFIWNNYVYRR